MNRRELLSGASIALLGGVAGCTEGSDGDTTPGQPGTESPSSTEDGKSSEARTATSTVTPELSQPRISELSVKTEGEYEGDEIPKGATIIVSFTFESWAQEGAASGLLHITATSGGKVLDSVEDEFEITSGKRKLVRSTHKSLIETVGYPSDELTVSVTIEDQAGGLRSESAETVVTIANYTRSEFRNAQRSLGEIENLIDEACNAYVEAGNGSILSLEADQNFTAGAVSAPAREARSIATNHINQEITPLLQQLKELRTISTAIMNLAETQEDISEAANAVNEIRPRLEAENSVQIRSQIKTASNRIDNIRVGRTKVDEEIAYPLNVANKVEMFKSEQNVLESLVKYSEGLVDPIEYLEDARDAFGYGNYSEAEVKADEASSELEDQLSGIIDHHTLDDLIDFFEDSTEKVISAATELRIEAAERQD